MTAPVVIVPCGGRKLATSTPVPAGELYVGGYHRAARRAADVLAAEGGRVLILSALHGLLQLEQPVLPYELRAGDPGTVDGGTLRAQAAALGVADTPAVVLAGRAYVALARLVWPSAVAPLEGTRGIGEQRARLSAMSRRPARVNFVTLGLTGDDSAPILSHVQPDTMRRLR